MVALYSEPRQQLARIILLKAAAVKQMLSKAR
jgi:hypothetical protein